MVQNKTTKTNLRPHPNRAKYKQITHNMIETKLFGFFALDLL
jgi:hypothetical protein